MRKLQQGGSVIYDVDTGKGVPNVTYVPTLEVPELKFTALSSALDTYEKIRQEEDKTYRGNMVALNKLYDDVTKVRYDNDVQRQEIETAKQRAGLTEDVFNMSVDQLKNPYIMGPVSRAAADFSNDMGLRGILQEQAMFDSGIASFAKNAPSNPKLREMFAAQVEQYKNGEIKGTDINPQAFMEVDLAGELGKLLKDIPLYTQSELQESGGVISEQEVKQRSQAAIEAVVGYALSNPQWVNNMKARGFMDDNNDLTEDGTRFIQGIRDAYEQASTDIKGITKVKGGVGSSAGVGAEGGTVGLGAARGYEKADASIFDNYASLASRYGLDVSTDPETALIIDGAVALTKKGAEGITPEMAIANTKKQLRQRAMNDPIGGVFAWYEHAVEKGYAGSLYDFANAISSNGWAAASAEGATLDPAIKDALTELRPGREQQTWDSLRQRAMEVPDAIESAQTRGFVSPEQAAAAQAAGTEAPQSTGISGAFIEPSGGGTTTTTTPPRGTGGGIRTRKKFDSATTEDKTYPYGPSEEYISLIIKNESGGKRPGKDPNSNAQGYAGFIDSTWMDIMKDLAKEDPEVRKQLAGKTNAEVLAMRMDPNTYELQRKAVAKYAQKSGEYLEKKGFARDDVSLALAHYLGPAGAVRLLRADRKTLFKNAASEGAYKANPHDHWVTVNKKKVREKTVQDVINRVAAKVGFYTPQSFDTKKFKYYKSWEDVNGGEKAPAAWVKGRVIGLADAASAAIGKQLPINSSHRTKKGNEAVGGAAASRHLHGDALDLSLRGLTDSERKKVLKSLMSNGASFVRFYPGDTYIHVDMRPTDSDKTTFNVAPGAAVPGWAKEFVK